MMGNSVWMDLLSLAAPGATLELFAFQMGAWVASAPPSGARLPVYACGGTPGFSLAGRSAA
jgi:hypothetical protein